MKPVVVKLVRACSLAVKHRVRDLWDVGRVGGCWSLVVVVFFVRFEAGDSRMSVWNWHGVFKRPERTGDPKNIPETCHVLLSYTWVKLAILLATLDKKNILFDISVLDLVFNQIFIHFASGMWAIRIWIHRDHPSNSHWSFPESYLVADWSKRIPNSLSFKFRKAFQLTENKDRTWKRVLPGVKSRGEHWFWGLRHWNIHQRRRRRLFQQLVKQEASYP